MCTLMVQCIYLGTKHTDMSVYDLLKPPQEVCSLFGSTTCPDNLSLFTRPPAGPHDG